MSEEQKVQGDPSAWDAVVDEAAKAVAALGKALVVTLQDVTSYVAVKTDAPTRERLDLLVEAGVAESRGAAAEAMLAEGLKSKQAWFEKVARTQAQIAELRKQMRTVVAGQS